MSTQHRKTAMDINKRFYNNLFRYSSDMGQTEFTFWEGALHSQVSFFSQSVLFLCNNFDLNLLQHMIFIFGRHCFIDEACFFRCLPVPIYSIGHYLMFYWTFFLLTVRLDFDLSPSFDIILFVFSTLFHFRFRLCIVEIFQQCGRVLYCALRIPQYKVSSHLSFLDHGVLLLVYQSSH